MVGQRIYNKHTAASFITCDGRLFISTFAFAAIGATTIVRPKKPRFKHKRKEREERKRKERKRNLQNSD
jgi:hypothetical protein